MKNENKKEKKSKKGLIILLVLLLLVIGSGIALYLTIFGETGNDSPVYGKNNRRCKVSTVISNDQIAAANAAIANVEGLASGNVEVNCLTVNISLTFKEEVPLESAKVISTSITHLVDDSMGFDRYNATDPYSKIFSVITSDSMESERMYDINITIANESGAYSIFGTKHYQNTEVVYTDNLPKDQSLVDSLHESQQTTTETETTTESTETPAA